MGIPCSMEKARTMANYAILCRRHFTISQFTNINLEKLNRNAVPSQNIHQPGPDHEVVGNMSTGVAKWAYVKKLFDIDNTNCRFRAVPKLTEECFNASGASAMKVRLAARVMSYSVAAGIDSLVSNDVISGSVSVAWSTNTRWPWQHTAVN